MEIVVGECEWWKRWVRRRRNQGGEGGEGSLGAPGPLDARGRTISTSTLDSDAAPLDPDTIDALSAARAAEAAAREAEAAAAAEEERRAKEERRRRRRERKELKRLAMARALDAQAGADGEFEGFQVRGTCL